MNLSDTSLQNGKHLSYSPPPPYSPQATDITRHRGIRVHNSSIKCESPLQHSHSDFMSNGKTASSIASSSSTHSNANMLPRYVQERLKGRQLALQ